MRVVDRESFYFRLWDDANDVGVSVQQRVLPSGSYDTMFRLRQAGDRRSGLPYDRYPIQQEKFCAEHGRALRDPKLK